MCTSSKMFVFTQKSAFIEGHVMKKLVAQNKSNLLLKNHFYNMSTLQLIQLKMV